MSDAKPKPYLTLELRCGCGGNLFAEVPQETTFNDVAKALLELGTAWTKAHAAHHQEPKRV